MKKVWRNKRGISLAEAVIAMAVILLVSAAATTLITLFARSSARMTQRNEATNITENCLECFVFCDSKVDFDAQLGGLDYTFEVDGNTYTIEGQDYLITMEINFGAEAATFAAEAHDRKGRSILEIPVYTRYYQQ